MSQQIVKVFYRGKLVASTVAVSKYAAKQQAKRIARDEEYEIQIEKLSNE